MPQPSPVLPSSFAGGRYVVQRFLGEGGRKRVYLAHDTKLDRDVAIAVIKTEGLDADGLARVRREAEAMGRLGDHPHIVTVYDVLEEQGTPVIVSRYMAGGSVEDLLAKADSHRLTLEHATQLAEQVCGALDHAHRQGIVHRDLKPGNVWLTEQGTAMLGDFGLAVALDRSRMTVQGMIVGTVAYMPPEQALGRNPDARSDLYSLGAMLYEMLTGRPPFLGDDAIGIISQHINTAPIATTWHNPGVPAKMDELVMRLLAKVPEDRPASAVEVASALAALAAAPPPVTAGEAPPAPAAAQVRGFRRGPFVGREKEMAQLKERFEDALSEHGSLVMLVGEPGIGKTRLAEELSVYARLRGAQALTGQCYETEGAPPYIPFVEALRQYVNSCPAEELRREMGDGASDLAKLVSEVRTRVPDVPPGPEQEPEAERYRLLEAVTSFLLNASKANPLLLILDDLHWADKPSLLLLEHLARRLSSARILVVGTYRDVELDRRHPLSEVIAGLRRERLYERVLLRGLDPEGVRALLAGRGAMSGRPEQYVNPALSNALYEQTEGNPFFIEEIILNLVDVGALYRKEGQWQVRMSVLAEHIPEGVREVIGRRLSRLSEATNQALTFASVLGREFDFDVLQALSEMEDETLLSALEEALGAQLINEQRTAVGAAYRFSHALVQETLYGELSIARKQRVHLRAGRALEQARAGRLEAHVGQLAYHFHQGNEREKAIDYCRRAGEASVRIYAWEEALKHWETALELMEERGDPDIEHAELLERLGDLAYSSGVDYERGYDFLERALAIYERVDARGKAAGIHSRLGRNMVSWAGRMDVNRALPHLEAARDALEEEAPDSQPLAYTYIGLALAYNNALQPGKALDYSRRARAIGERLGSDAVVANAQIFEGFVMASMGQGGEGAALVEKAWRAADRQGWTLIAFTAAAFRAILALNRRDPRTARRWLEEELSRPRTASAPMAQHHLLRGLAGARFMMGDVEEALSTLETGGWRLYLARATGDWEDAEADLTAVGDAGRREGVLVSAVSAATDIGELRLRQGLYDSAVAIMGEALELAQQQHGLRLGLRSLLAIAEAKRGRLDLADEQLELCRRMMAEGDGWAGATGLVALAEGVVSGAKEKWSEAEGAFERAFEIGREYGVPWQEADALHERARMYLARGEQGARKQALRLLDETAAIYQRLGAKRDLELVLADKLRAQGVDAADAQTSIDRVAASVHAEHPDLRPHAAPDGTVTIMFSDIEGSTEMTERLGDKQWMEVLREHNAIVRKHVKSHGGFEVKSEGDGFMLAFQSARRALECAIDIQRALTERNEGAKEPIRVRIGLHTGEAVKEGGDFFGKHVNLAARIAGQATGGEILASSLLKELTDSAGEFAFGDGREVELKGLVGSHRVFAVAWR